MAVNYFHVDPTFHGCPFCGDELESHVVNECLTKWALRCLEALGRSDEATPEGEEARTFMRTVFNTPPKGWYVCQSQ